MTKGEPEYPYNCSQSPQNLAVSYAPPSGSILLVLPSEACSGLYRARANVEIEILKVEGTAGEICVLSEITELPEAVLAYIQGRVPTFKLKFSKTIEQKYFASTCPKCGVFWG
jgi:hypothetical protein